MTLPLTQGLAAQDRDGDTCSGAEFSLAQYVYGLPYPGLSPLQSQTQWRMCNAYRSPGAFF